MTFRSFSRFVRWYRWPMLVLGAFIVLALRYPFVLVFTPVLALPPAFWWIELKPWPKRVLDRAAKARRQRADRLRAMPLRGWTK